MNTWTTALPLGLYRYTIETNAGPQEKEAVLGEADPLWVELRHMHIAAVLNTLAEKAKQFSSAKHGGAGARGKAELVVCDPRRIERRASGFQTVEKGGIESGFGWFQTCPFHIQLRV